MARRSETRHCRTCGDAYQATVGSSVVNCPRHRGRPGSGSTRREAISSTDREKYRRMGYEDGRKRGHLPGFSGYRSEAFRWSISSGRLLPYEDGFREGRKAAAR